MSAKSQKALNSKKLRWVNIFIHISAALMFFLPEILTNIDDDRPMPYGVIIKTLIYIVLFYINYFTFNYFIDSKGGRWKFFGMNFLLLICGIHHLLLIRKWVPPNIAHHIPLAMRIA